MEEIIIAKTADIEREHRSRHEGYECYVRRLVRRRSGGQCEVAMYEIPPGKSAYPYHYHMKNEESFYILSGTGLLKSPSGDRTVCAGDLLFFPAGEGGAHKLTNTSDSQMLVYIDFDTSNDIEVAIYPDSGKIGIWGGGINKVYNAGDNVDYYEGE